MERDILEPSLVEAMAYYDFEINPGLALLITMGFIALPRLDAYLEHQRTTKQGLMTGKKGAPPAPAPPTYPPSPSDKLDAA